MFPMPASPHCRKTPGPAALCCVLGGCSQSSLQQICRAKGQERAEGLRDAPGKGPHRGRSSEWEGAGEPGPRRPVLRGQAWGRRHRRHLDRWLGAWDLHPEILGGPAGPGGGASSRGRPGLRCRGAGIRVLGVRDEAGTEGGKGGCGRRPGVDGVGRTVVPCVHCPFPRVPFESGAAGNIRRTPPSPPPSHSRHQSRWAQGGDGKETRGQHHQVCREQRGAGRGRGVVTGCPHHLLREREARPAGFPFLRFHIRLHPLLKKVPRKENAKPDVTSARQAMPSAGRSGASGDTRTSPGVAAGPGQALLTA